MPLPFYPHAFRVVNQQVDAEAGRVLGAAGQCFVVVKLLIHHAIQPNAVQPKQPANALSAAVGSGIHPHFPAALAAGLGQILNSVAKLLVAQKLRPDVPLGSCQWKIVAIANERVVEVESEAHSG